MQGKTATADLMDDDPVSAVSAVRAVFEERYGQLVALAVTIFGDRSDAEDVVQDAFASVIRRSATLRTDVSGYVVQSVVNGVRSRLRRRAVERRPWAVERVRDAPAESGEMFELVRRLPKRQAQVILCRFGLDLTVDDVAKVLGISRVAARTHADRGMNKLKQWIEEETT